jgi:hypothetical protein
MVDPCAKHLECFNGCRHLSATDLTETRQNLVQLEARLDMAVRTIEERKQRLSLRAPLALDAGVGAGDAISSALQPSPRSIRARVTSGIGIDIQLSHAKTRLKAVRKLLATAPGERVFPDGPDLSVASNEAVGRVFDDIL